MQTKSVLTMMGAMAMLGLLSLPVFAHGGVEHVAGNVVTVANNVLTVKTSTGNVDVKLDGKTEVTKNKLKAQVTDLTPGTRVVIDIPEGGKEKIAGAAPAAAAESHEHEGHH